MEERELKCLRCGEKLRFARREELQLGSHTFLGGDLGNLLAGSLLTDIYVCPGCGRLEFYSAESEGDFCGPAVGNVTCARCGRKYPASEQACPLCGLRRKDG